MKISNPLRRGLCLLALAGCSHALQADPLAPENFTARFQSTYNWQTHSAYAAAYSGPNSVYANREKMYTFSATAHFGIRLGAGTELYFNPEISQGVPFSNNLVGLGGFTNGEITRAAGANPTPYRQRLFVRQVWNGEGEQTAVAEGFNQLAGMQSTERVVLTAGNFSILDVFDGNAYAKDPRSQFMNWGGWTYAAYDYAADARGFGWGATLEWYRKDWVWRIGRMTGPQTPNALPLDFALAQHYGDQVEVEHAHQLGELPGKVRVMAWRNRAQLASFNDALTWLKANPGNYTGPDALVAVRSSNKIKYGLGVNVEQALNDHAGAFLRAMQTDGRTETLAFTEVDASLATGLHVHGNRWGRPDDHAGLALMRNYLSPERRRFLAAGGISYFIGDGALHYAPETIIEGYYNLSLPHHTNLSLDYQRIQNPAYNAARGPLHVFAVRAHVEF